MREKGEAGTFRKHIRCRRPKPGVMMVIAAAALLLAGAGRRGGNPEGGENHPTAPKNLRLAGSTSMEEMTSALAEGFMNKYPEITVTVEFTGSSAGAEALISGKADIANMSRSLSREEKEKGLAENIVAWDGILICTDASNELSNLTAGQLRDIYKGTITNWSQIGGKDIPVVTVGREAGSGTREAFEKLLSLEEQCKYANIMDSAGAVAARAARTPGVIGYISLDAVNEGIHVLNVEGRAPTAENIRRGDYFLSRSCIMATKGEISRQSPLVQAWFRYLYSEEGKKIIEGAGLVPVWTPETAGSR